MAISQCPECGAIYSQELSCWDVLGLIIAWEYADADLLREHFLTVASYNFQHPTQFTDTALVSLWSAYTEYLDNQLALAEIRRRVGQAHQGATRVLKPAAERSPSLRRWTMTIADVYDGGQAEGAAERVRAWARSIRDER
ncbi:hypothetical protein HC891_19715 [Candidatus Gracilibacteria bacterium]|nr:hypothetical protein [Candidatus Gracilibacteria bacterium]